MDQLIEKINSFMQDDEKQFSREDYIQLQSLCEGMKPYFVNSTMAPVPETKEKEKEEETIELIEEKKDETAPVDEMLKPIKETAVAETTEKDEEKETANVQEKIDKHIETIKSYTQENREIAIINDDPEAKIYVIGDIEGHIQLLYNWFINTGLIDTELNWKGDNNTYVVQCGDQLDSDDIYIDPKYIDPKTKKYTYHSEDHARIQLGEHSDLEVIIFMDYLNIISGGKVLNIIGNHEIMNLEETHVFNYAKIRDTPAYLTEEFRIKLFDKDGPKNIINKILLRRNFIIRINKCIFCHGGITENEYKSVNESSIDEFINTINNNLKEYNSDYLGKKMIDPVLRAIYLQDETGILWNRFTTNKLFPAEFKEKRYKVFTGHNSAAYLRVIKTDDTHVIDINKFTSKIFDPFDTNSKNTLKFTEFDMIITDINTRQSLVKSTEKCDRYDDNNLFYVLLDEKEQTATAAKFACCLPKCADIHIFTEALKKLAEMTGGADINLTDILSEHTRLLEIFNRDPQKYGEYKRLRLVINKFIKYVLFIGIIIRIIAILKVTTNESYYCKAKYIKSVIHQLNDTRDKTLDGSFKLIYKFIHDNISYLDYYNIANNVNTNFEKLMYLLNDKIISQKAADFKYKLTELPPSDTIKDFISNLSNRNSEIKRDFVSDNNIFFQVLQYILLNGDGTNTKLENFLLLKDQEIPENFTQLEISYLPPDFKIAFKNKCTNALQQFAGTCYFNSVINGVFLSNNFYKFLRHKLIEYYSGLSDEEKPKFLQQGMTCLGKDGIMDSNIFYNLVKHYICSIGHKFEKVEGDEITEIAESILHKRDVNEGGEPNKVIQNILKILFKEASSDYCKIMEYPKTMPETPKGFILDHINLGIYIQGNPNSDKGHAVVGTFCYDDNVPIIIDSNKPYNPLYIDWRDPKNNTKILQYFRSTYPYNEGTELELMYIYVCYLNEQKLQESKDFIAKPENVELLNICTNYKKDS